MASGYLEEKLYNLTSKTVCLDKHHNGIILVPVRTSFGLRQRGGKAYNVYQRKVDVDMLNAVKCVLADLWSISPSSEQRGLMVETSAANTLFTGFSISTST